MYLEICLISINKKQTFVFKVQLLKVKEKELLNFKRKIINLPSNLQRILLIQRIK